MSLAWFTTESQQWGFVLSYSDFDAPSGGIDASAGSIGPTWAYNWTQHDRNVPFVQLNVQKFIGDIDDILDLSYGVAFGVKIMVQDRVAVRIEAFWDRVTVESGVVMLPSLKPLSDQDFMGLKAGISIFF